MSRSKISIVAALALVLSSFAGAVFGGRGADPTTLPPLNTFVMGMCTDQQFLYVVAAGKVVQYNLSDLTLLKMADLPEIVPPSSVPPAGLEAGKAIAFPPPFARSNSLLISGGSLYVMVGPVICRYSLPDLSLQSTVDLPKPDLPPPTGEK